MKGKKGLKTRRWWGLKVQGTRTKGADLESQKVGHEKGSEER